MSHCRIDHVERGLGIHPEHEQQRDQRCDHDDLARHQIGKFRLAVGEVTLLLWSIHGGVSKLHEEWPGFASEDSNSTAGSECDAIEQIKNGFDLATRRGECDAWRAGDALVLLTRT